MRRRYKNTKIVDVSRESKGTNYITGGSITKYATTFYANVPETNNDVYVITQEGDRLDNLAYQYYGHPSLWWFIANVNNLNTMNVEGGLRLRIPTSTVLADAY